MSVAVVEGECTREAESVVGGEAAELCMYAVVDGEGLKEEILSYTNVRRRTRYRAFEEGKLGLFQLGVRSMEHSVWSHPLSARP
jgi:hypothetical protein